MGLFDSIRFLAETAGSPLFPRNPLITCCEYEPRKHFNILANIGYIFSAFLWDEKSRLFHVRAISGLIISSNPACYLPVYASQDMLPYTTQDSVHDCWLGFVTVVISGHLYPLNFQGAIIPYPFSLKKEGGKSGLFANSRFSPLFLKREGPGVSSPFIPIKNKLTGDYTYEQIPYPLRPGFTGWRE